MCKKGAVCVADAASSALNAATDVANNATCEAWIATREAKGLADAAKVAACEAERLPHVARVATREADELADVAVFATDKEDDFRLEAKEKLTDILNNVAGGVKLHIQPLPPPYSGGNLSGYLRHLRCA